VRRAATRRHVPLSVCGEMASDPAVLALLIGLGFAQFSMTPTAIPVAHQVIQDLDSRELQRMAARALRLGSAPEIEQYLTEALTGSKVLRF
jgi:phosphoenolpyruvate-protein phosphotransferase (PTS system enzyme I)